MELPSLSVPMKDTPCSFNLKQPPAYSHTTGSVLFNVIICFCCITFSPKAFRKIKIYLSLNNLFLSVLLIDYRKDLPFVTGRAIDFLLLKKRQHIIFAIQHFTAYFKIRHSFAFPTITFQKLGRTI